MIHYLLINTDGSVAQRGEAESENLIPVLGDTTREIIEPDDPRKPRQRKNTYIDFRQMDYPPMGEQLGAIWKCLEEAGLLKGEALEISKRIKAVKESRPKD